MRGSRLSTAGETSALLPEAELSLGRTGTREARRNALVRMDRPDPALSGSKQAGYRFGEFRLEPDGTLLRGETPVAVEARELKALRLLLAHPGQVVSLDQLRHALFGGEPADADSVAQCLDSLAKHLQPEDCIEAVARRGYRFTAEVQPLGPQALPALPRLAILPFLSTFGVPEYLGSAIAEDAAAGLGSSEIPVAIVLARDSVFSLARRGIPPREVGEKMQADLVLSGELRAMASRYRLRAELIRVDNGSPLWAEELLVDRALVIEMVRDLVQRLTRRLSGFGLALAAAAAPAVPVPEPTPEQREAYELFAHGRHEWQTLERHRIQDAVQHLERALELDPGRMDARVNLVNLCLAQSACGFLPPQAGAEMVRRVAGPVDDVPPQGEALLPALGWTLFHAERDLSGALRAFARSAHLPQDPWTTRARVLLHLSRGHFGQAIEAQRAALRHDPYSAWLQARLSWAYHLAGEAQLSVQTAHAAIKQFPGEDGPELYGAMILAFNGEAPEAVKLAHDLDRRIPYFDPAAAVYAYALAQVGRRDEARAVLERLQWLRRERYVLNTFSAAAYAALGDLEAALGELRSAEDLRCPWFFQMLADPRVNSLRGRPEYAAMQGILAAMEAEAARRPVGD